MVSVRFSGIWDRRLQVCQKIYLPVSAGITSQMYTLYKMLLQLHIVYIWLGKQQNGLKRNFVIDNLAKSTFTLKYS